MTQVPPIPDNIVVILSEMAMYRRQRIETAQAFLGHVNDCEGYREGTRLLRETDEIKAYLMALVFQDAERRAAERAQR